MFLYAFIHDNILPLRFLFHFTRQWILPLRCLTLFLIHVFNEYQTNKQISLLDRWCEKLLVHHPIIRQETFKLTFTHFSSSPHSTTDEKCDKWVHIPCTNSSSAGLSVHPFRVVIETTPPAHLSASFPLRTIPRPQKNSDQRDAHPPHIHISISATKPEADYYLWSDGWLMFQRW